MGRLREEYPEIPWIALTATAPQKVKIDLIKNLSLKNVQSFQVSCFRQNLYYDIKFKNLLKDDFIDLKSDIDHLLRVKEGEQLADSDKPCGIIYCRKKDTTESVARSLRKLGLKCAAFHSGLKKSEKETVQNDWMAGRCPIIAATISFGMGIDKGPVRFVIHWDVPQSISNWYQESGRAGRDGKKSFCRVYYDRDEVKSMSFILRQEIGKKSKNEEQLKIAELTFKEFAKISEHCEGAQCRHKLFTDFFGDPAPKCDKMCDSCKDKKTLLKKIDEFEMVSNQGAFEKYNKIPDQDFSDLYEGGKKNSAVSGSFEDYEDGEYSGFQSAKDVLAKQQRDIIQKQFALRKANAAEAIQNIPTTQISRVKQAMSTEVKVSGLKTATRESSLDFIVEKLMKNKDKAELCDPPETPDRDLKRADFEDIAKKIEYEIFSKCQAISVYRMKISRIGVDIVKTAGLYSSTKNHIPKSRQSFGGDLETIKNDLKKRYGEDVVQELESEQAKKTERKKKDKFAQSGRDGLNQPKIKSFFTSDKKDKKPKHDQQPDSTKVEQVKQEIKDEPIEIEDDPPQPPPIVDVNLSTSNKNQKVVEPKSEAERSFSLEERIAQLEKTKKKSTETSQEITNDEDHRHAEKQMPLNPSKRKLDDNGTYESSPKRKREDSDRPSKDKKKISDLIVSELNVYYKTKRFCSSDPRSLFKNVARAITHQCISLGILSESDIKSRIHEFFKHKKVIREIQDVGDAMISAK